MHVGRWVELRSSRHWPGCCPQSPPRSTEVYPRPRKQDEWVGIDCTATAGKAPPTRVETSAQQSGEHRSPGPGWLLSPTPASFHCPRLILSPKGQEHKGSPAVTGIL